jgi:Flp pilus assembly protein TadG
MRCFNVGKWGEPGGFARITRRGYWMRPIGGRRRHDRGASLVEFALIAPLLFLLLFGVIEFARLIHGFTTVWSAAREGARYATTVGDTDGNGTANYLDCDAILAAALSKVAGMTLSDSDITVKYFDGNAEVADCDGSPPAAGAIDSGFSIEVAASAEFDAIVPLLSVALDGIDLDSTQTRSIFKGVVGAG